MAGSAPVGPAGGTHQYRSTIHNRCSPSKPNDCSGCCRANKDAAAAAVAAPATVAPPETAPEATATEPEAPSPPAAATSAPELPNLSGNSDSSSTSLPELWQQILGSLELPSTRMLLSQQGQLVRLDANRAVVQVAGNWMGMVQSRAALLEQAIAKALGGSRQLVLESQSGAMPPAPVVTPPVVTPQAPQAQQPVVVESPSAQTVVNNAPARPLEQPSPAPVSQPSTPATPQVPPAQQTAKSGAPATGIERQAKNLADFFNGQVLDVNLDE